ncbi:MAG: ABC transporter ATP-binding protein, partial [Gammaproteobacteria bacterium]|nr:ABC transporter ATP-binding protein [Gammaproteobacteria bacterium]
LKVETFLFYLQEAVTQVPEIAGYVLRQLDETTLEVDVTSEQKLSSLFSALGEQGIEVKSMKNKSNRLEELFVSMVEGGQQ